MELPLIKEIALLSSGVIDEVDDNDNDITEG